MYHNNGCCTPPVRHNHDCSCKDGMLCALDWFFQDFLLKPTDNNCITTLYYYPQLPSLLPVPPAIDPTIVPNLIYNIPYLTSDIVPVYTDECCAVGVPYQGDITYLNICKLNGFEFTLKDTCKLQKESDIQSRFSKIKFCSPSSNCCKNGILESLLKARDFLLQDETGLSSVILSNYSNSFRIKNILAINSDTVWAKIDTVDALLNPITKYYVISICELIGITLDKITITQPSP